MGVYRISDIPYILLTDDGLPGQLGDISDHHNDHVYKDKKQDAACGASRQQSMKNTGQTELTGFLVKSH
jgi:hypothetical protein